MNRNNIKADNIIIGKNVIIEENVKIRGIEGNAKQIIIGDNVYIGDSVQIICDEFAIGDYAKIHHHTNIHGYKPCNIGHNAWIGQYTIIDSIGSVTIGNNFCLSAHSHLWSHMRFGDTLEGCRFAKEKALIIGHDVWIGGHCTITPIIAEDKSMALAGSIVTKNMRYNQIYAGNPAKSISHKLGFQFNEIPIVEKYNKLVQYLEEAHLSHKNIKIVSDLSEMNLSDDVSYFDVSTRQYKKTGNTDEVKFMRFLLPIRAKFTPLVTKK